MVVARKGPDMTRRARRLIVLVVIMVLVVVAACVVVPMWAYGQAQRDVMAKARELADLGRPVSITSAEMSLSFSHGLLVICRVEGLQEISAMVWYLLPWRSIVTEM